MTRPDQPGREHNVQLELPIQIRPWAVFLVARYDSETGGHFGPHRDDKGSRSRIAGSPSRSISTRISKAARFHFPIQPGTLQGRARNRNRLFRHDSPRSIARDARAPLCVPHLPVRRGGRADETGEFAGHARGAASATIDGYMKRRSRCSDELRAARFEGLRGFSSCRRFV
jgi:hypothetical protein